MNNTGEQIFRIIVGIGVLTGTYLLLRWMIGDLPTKPISQFTLENISLVIFAVILSYFVFVGTIKSIINHD